MKKLLLTAAFGLACVCAFGQGYLNFANVGVGVNYPISDTVASGGARLAGAAFGVDLYWGAAGTTDSSTLTALGLPATFLTGAQAGYFTGGQRNFALAGGTTIVCQIRGWDMADGASWLAVSQSASATARIGNSGLFNVTLTALPTTPVNLTGLGASGVGFNLTPVPEPTTFALAGLGAAALLIFRRRK